MKPPPGYFAMLINLINSKELNMILYRGQFLVLQCGRQYTDAQQPVKNLKRLKSTARAESSLKIQRLQFLWHRGRRCCGLAPPLCKGVPPQRLSCSAFKPCNVLICCSSDSAAFGFSLRLLNFGLLNLPSATPATVLGDDWPSCSAISDPS